MRDRVRIGSAHTLLALGERASMRSREFFAANIRNPHTRRAMPCGGEVSGGLCERRCGVDRRYPAGLQLFRCSPTT